MTWEVDLNPIFPSITIILCSLWKAAMTSSALAFLPSVTISEWRCMWVVGILIAIVVMLRSGMHGHDVRSVV